MTAQTAWMAMVTVGAVEAGQRVLIHGATGGVGSLAVQIAKSRGAFVVGTGSTHSRALAQSLGVDRFIDYRTESVKDAVSDIDVVLDTIGGQTQEDSYGVMRPGGILIATALPPSPERAEAAGVRAQFIFTASSGDVLDQISALVDSGKLRPIIGAELSLADAARAHQISQSGRAGGKIVLYVAMP